MTNFKVGDCVYHKPTKKMGIVDIVYSTGALDLTWLLDPPPYSGGQMGIPPMSYHVVAPNDCDFLVEVEK